MPTLYFLDTSALLPRLLRRAPGHAWVERIVQRLARIRLPLRKSPKQKSLRMNQLYAVVSCVRTSVRTR